MPAVPSPTPSACVIPAVLTCPTHFDIARTIFSFFLLNIFAHALTRMESPGQTTFQAVGTAVFRILSPVYSRSSDSHTFRMVLKATSKRLREIWREGGWRAFFCRDGWVAVFGDSRNRWPLQSAVNAGAIVIPFNPDFESDMRTWKKVRLDSIWSKRRILYMDGRMVDDPHAQFVYLPVGVRVTKLANRSLKPSSSSSWIPTTVAVGQLIYSSFELYQSDYHEIRQRGLASPFIVVIPYIVMTFVNLVIDVCVGSYPLTIALQPVVARKESSSSLLFSADQPEKKGVRPLLLPNLHHTESMTTIESSFSSSTHPSDAITMVESSPLLHHPHVTNRSNSLESEIEHMGNLDTSSPFAQWLLDTYGLILEKHIKSGSELSAWQGKSGAINLGVCYAIITLILWGVSGMRVVNPLVVTSSLLWIYNGAVCYLVLCVFRVLAPLFLSRGWKSLYEIIESSPWVIVTVIATGPVIWGSYNVVHELAKIYSRCTVSGAQTAF